MFNKNTFLHHATNTTNHNKITNAGVKAPFSMNEQAFVFPTMYSGDKRPDVSRTGSPGRRDLGGMVGQAGNLAAAQLAAKNQNMISSLLDSHVHNAYQSGIDTHGHWDLTEKDSNAIIKPHFDEYFGQVKSIDPNANRESHYERFNAAVTEKAAKLHGWGMKP